MSKTLIDLLSVDQLSHQYGCGLNPLLRKAIEQDLRFPAVATSPRSQSLDLTEPMPPRVLLFKRAAGKYDTEKAG
ncbi:hypothetical protein [uncultured Roseobacter sp.]|uniref:hypothetical protein n=1 Tax=uncultured Roseobacter sp. TaxID=114847 RepID=UPI002632A79B|nr:hypothetical protein [uncultured Roseobacter sp.]